MHILLLREFTRIWASNIVLLDEKSDLIVGLHKEVKERELTDVLNNLSKDLEFLQSGISCLHNFQLNVWLIDVLEVTTLNNEHLLKLQSSAQREKELIIFVWKVKELTELNENGRQLHSDIKSFDIKWGKILT